jgi:bacterioferritin
MQAKEGVLERLNRHLTVELTAINQYFLHSEMCRNWGFERLANQFRELSMAEMQDAQKLVSHILYLEGIPNMQRLNDVAVGENVRELLDAGIAAERNAVAVLTEAIRHCHDAGDFTTRGMFEEMVAEEEEHVDWFETQFETINAIGMDLYLSQQMH